MSDLIERLKKAREFDEDQTDMEAKRQSKTSASPGFTDELNYATGFLHGARWQHVKDQALFDVLIKQNEKLLAVLQAAADLITKEYCSHPGDHSPDLDTCYIQNILLVLRDL